MRCARTLATHQRCQGVRLLLRRQRPGEARVGSGRRGAGGARGEETGEEAPRVVDFGVDCSRGLASPLTRSLLYHRRVSPGAPSGQRQLGVCHLLRLEQEKKVGLEVNTL